MPKPTNPDLLAQCASEALHPDAGVRAEAKSQRLEREMHERSEYVDKMLALLNEKANAQFGMIEALHAQLEALQRRVQ
ncbi:MAG: hypothetical protein MUC86_13990 [Burkholderiaceae bacterium]|jgi:hypothetical protein|nr:hypothetical protein [Burkholderiaceae bacterium]